MCGKDTLAIALSSYCFFYPEYPFPYPQSHNMFPVDSQNPNFAFSQMLCAAYKCGS